MRTTFKFLLSGLAVSALVACGGGDTAAGGGGGGGGGAAAAGTSPTSTPTAVLANTQTEADSGLAEVKAGYAGAATASAGAGVKGPFGIEMGSLPTGVAASIPCTSGNIAYDISGAPAAGSTISMTYNACSFLAGTTMSGAYNLKYDRYTSPTDWAYTATYANFTVTSGSNSTTVSGSTSCDLANNAISCYYTDANGRGWSSSMTYANGTLNGTYGGAYGTKTVKVTFTNFTATSGTAVIEGGEGTKLTIVRTGANAFTMTWSKQGAASQCYATGGASCAT